MARSINRLRVARCARMTFPLVGLLAAAPFAPARAQVHEVFRV
jgi:hypothetical protein